MTVFRSSQPYIPRPRKRHAAMIREIYGFRELADDAGARFR